MPADPPSTAVRPHRPAAPHPDSAGAAPPRRPHRAWRMVLSLLLIGHLWAVVGRPIEFATRGPTGPSPSATTFYRPVRGYSELLYLNHGYAFFAPDPGPSHLITAEMPSDDGGTTRRTFPDLQNQWPRLLYHRHFMLTEFLHNVYQPPVPDELAASRLPAAVAWRADRQRYEAVRDSMREHLAHAAGLASADEVRIERVEHRMPGLPEFLGQRMRLRDPRLYRILPDQPLPDALVEDQLATGGPNQAAAAPEPLAPAPLAPATVGEDRPADGGTVDPARREAALP